MQIQNKLLNPQHHRLVILGSGPAGCTAAIYAARANLAPTMIVGSDIGGQLVKTHIVDNWPGDAKGVVGFDLMQRMQQHVERFAVNTISDHIVKVNLQQKPFILEGQGGAIYTCDALIIATGASPRYIGLPAEQAYLGRGVSTCATCDGYFYKGARVAVVGGGNLALDDALYLSEMAKEVLLLHRRNEFRADDLEINAVQERAAQGKIKILLQHTVEDIVGSDAGVSAIKVKDLVSGQVREEAVNGVFVAVGTNPNSEPFVGQLEMQGGGYIAIKGGNAGNFTATSVPGVFAAGDIANPHYRQAIAAAGQGCMAALDAKKYLQ
jgi:thioredoxin-disulfide reductase